MRDQLFKRIGKTSPQVAPPRLAFSWGATILVAVFVFLASVTTTAIADNAKPGDFLFGVKKVVEKASLLFTRDPIKAAQFKLQIAGERLAAAEDFSSGNMSQILSETKVALADASKAVLAVGDGSTSALLDRLQGLLTTQEKLLVGLEKGTTDTELKSKIVAVRDELSEISSKIAPTKPVAATKPATAEVPSVTSPVATAPAPVPTLPLVGRLGTAYGAPALYVGDKYYQLKGLGSFSGWQQYVGYTNIQVFGTFQGENILVSTLLSGNTVIFSNPGGNP